MIRIVQRDRHIGIAKRLTHLRSGEDHVLHGRTSKLLDPLLSQHPSNGICHVALSGTVRTHDTGDAVMELEIYLIGKGFKPVHFNAF